MRASIVAAALYFLAFGLRKMQIPSPDSSRQFVYPGIAFLVLAGVLAYHLITT